MLAHLRSALRYLWRRPRDTGFAVAALALGTGATLTLAALVNAAFVAPLPYPAADRIVHLSERQAEIPDRRVSYPNFLDWQARNDSFELMAAVRETTPVLRREQGARVLDARQVTADYFRVLGVAPFIGRDFTAAEDRFGAPRVAIVSAALWSAEFGAPPDIVGRQLALGDGDYTIVGVADRLSQLPGAPEIWTLTGQLAAPDSPWFGRSNRIAGYVLARLRADRSIEEARADMRRVGDGLAAEFPIHNAGHTIDIVTLQRSLVGDVRLPLLLAFGAVGVLLLIVCTNVANLLLVAAIRREREFALRAALGADRRQVLAQVLCESSLLTLLGTGSGALLAVAALDVLRRVAPEAWLDGMGVAADGSLIAFAAAVCAFVSIAVGSVPAWRCVTTNVQRGLRGAGRAANRFGAQRVRNASIVVQASMAVALLVCAALLANSLLLIERSSFGFDGDDLLTFRLSVGAEYASRAQRTQLLARVASDLDALPGVASAALLNELPGREPTWQTDIAPVVGGESVRVVPGQLINVDWGIVSARYFETLRVPILRGRSFTGSEAEQGAPVMVIDEQLAQRFWPEGDALGSHIRYDGPTAIEIVGIAANVRTYGEQETGRVKIYTPYGRFPESFTVAVRAAGEDGASLVGPIRTALRTIDPGIAMSEIGTLDDVLERQITPRTWTTSLVALFAALAVALTALGIYAVMSQAVLERVREVGVRTALGARPRDILRLLVMRGMGLCGAGVALGSLLGLAASRLMAGMLYGVTPASGHVYVAGAAVFLAVALAACLAPALRAAKLDPLAALRHE
jgi:putative ABC transport system permease protein